MRLEELKRLLEIGRASPPLWLYPSLSLVVGLLIGLGLGRFQDVDAGSLAFLVYEGDPAAARSFLSLVATSLASVTTLTLSLTVVALQLASSQYSPRLIEHYLSDRTTHAVFSLFLGTFACSIATLLNVRYPDDRIGTAGRVPGIAISLVVVLSVSCLAALVFFIYRVTRSLRVEAVFHRIRGRTLAAIAARDEREPDSGDGDVPDAPAGATVIRSRRTGYYTALDRDAVRAFGAPGAVRVWVIVAPGDFVASGTPVALVDGSDDPDLPDAVEQWLSFDAERWIESDYSYGVRNLVDVALRALSPGINDPSTATMAVERIGELLAAAGRSHPNRRVRTDAGAEVYVAIREWDDTLRSAVRQIVEYGKRDVEVVAALVRMLVALAWGGSAGDAGVDRRREIREIGGLLRTWAELGVERPDSDRALIDDEWELLEAALRHEVVPAFRHTL